MPPPWPSMRSTARWVLPVLVGPSTAVTVLGEGINNGFKEMLSSHLGRMYRQVKEYCPVLNRPVSVWIQSRTNLARIAPAGNFPHLFPSICRRVPSRALGAPGTRPASGGCKFFTYRRSMVDETLRCHDGTHQRCVKGVDHLRNGGWPNRWRASFRALFSPHLVDGVARRPLVDDRNELWAWSCRPACVNHAVPEWNSAVSRRLAGKPARPA